MVDDAKLRSPFVQLLKCWLCDVQSGVVKEENWAHSVDQCQLQELLRLVHLIDFLGKLPGCNGFPGILKAIVV